MKYTARFATTLGVILALSLSLSVAKVSLADGGTASTSWRTAPRYSAGIAPDPVEFADTAIELFLHGFAPGDAANPR